MFGLESFLPRHHLIEPSMAISKYCTDPDPGEIISKSIKMVGEFRLSETYLLEIRRSRSGS